jgi:hypothetical protein
MKQTMNQSLSLVLIGMTLLYSPLTLAARASRSTAPARTSSATVSTTSVGASTASFASKCRGTRVYFNNRCRTVTWFQNNLSTSGADMLFVMGTTLKNLNEDAVVLVEQTAGGTLEYTTVESSQTSGGTYTMAPLGPTRNGHAVRSKTIVDYSYDGAGDLVLYTETLEPKVTMGSYAMMYGGTGWAWETVDWKRVTWLSSTHREICDEDGCATWIAAAGSDWSCQKLFDSAYAEAANECAAALATVAALVSISAAAFAVTITGGFAVLATPLAAGVAAGYVTTMGGAIAYMCNNDATQSGTEAVLAAGCIDVDTDTPGGGFDPGDDTPGGGDDGTESGGCIECDKWGEEGHDTAHWDEDAGELTVTHHTEVVCLEWSVDPMGEDSNGDGWCD